MTDPGLSIKVEGVSKKFCKSLKLSMVYGLTDIARNMVGMSSRSTKLRKREFWAVNDVSFELKKGETLGVIGPNGSGKSTLLKMLNGIFWPDKGKIELNGRVGALIEVGAGFHPMLTGRENIYINGAILGMSKQEIESSFDRIVDFADIGDFLDTPVKNYSSGMFVRLGFSIAVHCNPNILLIDEILAVGDAKFRSKAMERMWDISQKKGITIVLVSHNMLAIEGFCQRVILMREGTAYTGNKADLISNYLGEDTSERYSRIDPEIKKQMLTSREMILDRQTGEIKIQSVEILNKDEKKQEKFLPFDTLKVKVKFSSKNMIDNVVCSFMIKDTSGLILTIDRSRFHNIPPFEVNGSGEISFRLEKIRLKAGKYLLGIAFHDPTHNSVYCINHDHYFIVLEDMTNKGGAEGFFYPEVTWEKS